MTASEQFHQNCKTVMEQLAQIDGTSRIRTCTLRSISENWLITWLGTKSGRKPIRASLPPLSVPRTRQVGDVTRLPVSCQYGRTPTAEPGVLLTRERKIHGSVNGTRNYDPRVNCHWFYVSVAYGK